MISARNIADNLVQVLLRLADLAQHVAHIAGGAQFAADIGGEAQIALGVEPAGLGVRRQLAHDFGKFTEDRLDIARFEPPFPGHADLHYVPGLPRAVSLSEERELVALLRRRAEASGVERLSRAGRITEAAAGAVEARGEHLGIR